MSSEDVGTDVSQQVAESVVPQEQMVPQSKVNELVANAKLIAAEKAKKELEARYAQGTQPSSIGGIPQQPQSQEMPDFGKMLDEKLAEREQALLHQQQREYVKQLGEQYLDKMTKGEALYDDFKQVTSKFNPAKFGNVTLMAAQLDNTADVIYDLASNPGKLAQLESLAYIDRELAEEEIRKLSDSIKRNESAVANAARTSAPLSKLKASIAGTDNGKKTIADYKRMFRA